MTAKYGILRDWAKYREWADDKGAALIVLIDLVMAAQRETDALIVEAQEGITLITKEHDNVGDEWVKQLNIATAIRAGK